MRYKMTLATLLAASLMGAESFAGPPEKGDGEGRPKFGQRDGAGRRGREDGARGPRGPRGDMDPQQFVARLMQQFDKDGDQKLDAKELTSMLTAMRERRGAGPGMMGRPGAGKEGAGRRRPNNDDGGQPGGDKPRRPPVE